ncbi:MAG: hypothetical protein AB1815_11465 [Bacillota bacterium]
MSHKKAVSQVQFEISQIDRLLDSYSNLLEKSRNSEPDLVELTALASVLHSFYNGVENIFLTIAKRIDNNLPDRKHWHRDLLIQMSTVTSNRYRVISGESKLQLAEYLAFRHFYRHSYSFFLSWDEMDKLVNDLRTVWGAVKSDLNNFACTIPKE